MEKTIDFYMNLPYTRELIPESMAVGSYVLKNFRIA